MNEREALGDLEGKVVIMSKKFYKGQTEEERKFLCLGGFGCKADCMGNAVFGKFLIDGEECRVERYEIEKLSPDQTINIVKPKLGVHPCQ